VTAVEREEAVRVGQRGRQAGNGEDGLAASFARFQLEDLALDAADLSDKGKSDVVVQGGAGEQAAPFEAPVSFIEGLGAVGGNAPRSGR
jgi:hypothetical protein